MSLTLRQAVVQRVFEDDAFFHKLDAADFEHARVMRILRENPEIGMLMRNGKPVYYRGDRVATDPAALI